MNSDQGYITVATKLEEFLNFAINLRLSILYNDPDRPFCLVTDETLLSKITEFGLSHLFDEILIYKGDYISWEIKLELYKLSPFEETFYIDSDSLMIKNPNPAWSLLNGKNFSVQGPKNFNGKWYDEAY